MAIDVKRSEESAPALIGQRPGRITKEAVEDDLQSSWTADLNGLNDYERRAKMERLRAQGRDPYANFGSSRARTLIAELIDKHEPASLGEGEHARFSYCIAGRLTARRAHAKTSFFDVCDESGQIQVVVRAEALGPEAYQEILDLDIGDIISVCGNVYVTKRGQLALAANEFNMHAKALRSPPDRHHGLQDVETRYRQRELDLIANEDIRQLFIDRSRIISAVRAYLDGEGFVEVETPVLQPLYGGAMAHPFTTHHNALDSGLYLRIASELYLKRCIVGGIERVYELAKDFRNEGLSPKHNPEFTMVEWYEAYADYIDVASRLEGLVAWAARAIDYQGELNVFEPWRRVSYVEAVRQATGIDLSIHADQVSLAEQIRSRGLQLRVDGQSWSAMADSLLSKFVEPTLIQPTFVMDYPLELSPFARESASSPGMAERWEAFACGMEVANAFSELSDPDEQRRRFTEQERLQLAGQEGTQPYDEMFLQALEHGMPPTGGVGLGIDRLVMVLTGRQSIREVVLFPTLKGKKPASTSGLRFAAECGAVA